MAEYLQLLQDPRALWALGGLALFCLVLNFWAYGFWLYPLYLEGQVRRGKTWIYLPKFWKKHRFLLTTADLCLRLCWLGLCFGLGLALHFSFAFRHGHLATGIAGLILALGLDLLLRKLLLPLRFKEQQKGYFAELFAALEQSPWAGQRRTEQEIQARISWSHQNTLLKADTEGKFLKILKERAKAATPSQLAKEEPLAP